MKHKPLVAGSLALAFVAAAVVYIDYQDYSTTWSQINERWRIAANQYRKPALTRGEETARDLADSCSVDVLHKAVWSESDPGKSRSDMLMGVMLCNNSTQPSSVASVSAGP